MRSLTSKQKVCYNEITETISGTRSRKSSDFFIPRLWGMISGNKLNTGRSLIASVESPAYSKLSGITKTIRHIVSNIINMVDYLPIKKSRKTSNFKNQTSEIIQFVPAKQEVSLNSEIFALLDQAFSIKGVAE